MATTVGKEALKGLERSTCLATPCGWSWRPRHPGAPSPPAQASSASVSTFWISLRERRAVLGAAARDRDRRRRVGHDLRERVGGVFL